MQERFTSLCQVQFDSLFDTISKLPIILRRNEIYRLDDDWYLYVLH